MVAFRLTAPKPEMPGPIVPITEMPRTLVAAAATVKLDGQSVRSLKIGDDAWQKEAWRFYDLVGEFRFSANWFGNALSRCRIYVAELDELGRAGKEAAEEDVQVLSETIFGGPARKAEGLRSIGIGFFVAGESYVVAESASKADTDTWYVVSGSELRKENGRIRVARPPLNGEGPGTYELQPNRDLLMRAWTPHPRAYSTADSPARAVLPVLREIEQLTKLAFSQIDSRLISAGMLLFPQGTDFPRNGSQAPGIQGLMDLVMEGARAQLAGAGTAAGLVPIMAEIPAGTGGDVTHLKFDTPLTGEIRDKLDHAIRRLALGLDLPPEIMLGQGSSNHWCVDDQTEILTTEGWKLQGQLSVGDVALTLNHSTGLSEWQSVEDVYRAEVVDEPMVHLDRKGHSSLTTGGHRWPVMRDRWTDKVLTPAREWITSAELSPAHAVITAAPSGDLPVEAKYADAFVELVGWYWTEGNDGTSLSIAQSHTRNPLRVDRIRQALTSLYGPATTDRMGRGGPQWREVVQPNEGSYGGPVTVFRLNRVAAEPLRAVAPQKRVSLEFVRSLTRAQLELFIDISCQGDGWHYRAGRLDIWQRDRVALEAYELAVILSGRMVSTIESSGGWAVSPYQRNTTRPMKALNGAHERVTVDYSGVVWCPVTPNGTWFARRAGTTWFTGNSAWQIEEGAIKVHIETALTRICDALTEGYLKPALTALGKDSEKYTLWYDVSPLAARPNRFEDAIQLYDRGELSGAALITAAAFDEDDVISSKEKTEWRLWELLKLNPALASNPEVAKLLALPVMEEAPAPAPPPIQAEAGPAIEEPVSPRALPSTQNPPPAEEPGFASMLSGAEQVVLRALEIAGGRLLDRNQRGKHPEVAKFEMHTRVRARDSEHSGDLMRDAFTHLPALAGHHKVRAAELEYLLRGYCTELLIHGYPHSPELLRTVLEKGWRSA